MAFDRSQRLVTLCTRICRFKHMMIGLHGVAQEQPALLHELHNFYPMLRLHLVLSP